MILSKVHQYQEAIPHKIDLVELRYKLMKEDNPLNVVLMQEL